MHFPKKPRIAQVILFLRKLEAGIYDIRFCWLWSTYTVENMLTRICGANGGSFWLGAGCDSGPNTFVAQVSMSFESSNSGILQHCIGSTSFGGGTKHFSSTCGFCWHSTDKIENAVAMNTITHNEFIFIWSPNCLNTPKWLFLLKSREYYNRIVEDKLDTPIARIISNDGRLWNDFNIKVRHGFLYRTGKWFWLQIIAGKW